MGEIGFEFEVAWGDCDPAGIVFYPCYFRWLDVGTHRLLSAAGVPQRTLTAQLGIVGAALVSATCNFRRPATYGDRLLQRVRVAQWHNRNFVVAHSFWRAQDLVGEGSETRVLMVRENGGMFRAIPIPRTLRAALDAPGSGGGQGGEAS